MEKQNQSPEEFLEKMESIVSITTGEVNYKTLSEQLKTYRGYAATNVSANQFLNEVEQLVNKKY